MKVKFDHHLTHPTGDRTTDDRSQSKPEKSETIGYYLLSINKMAGGTFIFPTTNQCISCVQLCLDLTQLYIPIYLVRLDERDQRLIILAGQEIEIVIESEGNWKFL